MKKYIGEVNKPCFNSLLTLWIFMSHIFYGTSKSPREIAPAKLFAIFPQPTWIDSRQPREVSWVWWTRGTCATHPGGMDSHKFTKNNDNVLKSPEYLQFGATCHVISQIPLVWSCWYPRASNKISSPERSCGQAFMNVLRIFIWSWV